MALPYRGKLILALQNCQIYQRLPPQRPAKPSASRCATTRVYKNGAVELLNYRRSQAPTYLTEECHAARHGRRDAKAMLLHDFDLADAQCLCVISYCDRRPAACITQVTEVVFFYSNMELCSHLHDVLIF